MLDFKVGQRVYMHGRPLAAGIVTADHGAELMKRLDGSFFESSFHLLSVRWTKNNADVKVSAAGLRDFDSLIADHEKKLETHRKTLKKLELLAGAL